MIDSVKPMILIVDDEAEILYSLQGLLRREFDVQTAEGGRQALDLIAARAPQVIMTDQRMPGMTGAEFLAQAVQICRDAVPIIFTGYADVKAVVDAVNRGHVFRYLSKPWDPDDLMDVLREAVAHQQYRAEQHKLLIDVRQFMQTFHWDDRLNSDPLEQECRSIVQRIDVLLTERM